MVNWILTDSLLIYAQYNTINLYIYACQTADTIIHFVPQNIKAKLGGTRHREVCENSGSLHEVSFIGLSPNRELWAGVANSVLPFTYQSTP